MTLFPRENFDLLVKILKFCGAWPDKTSFKHEKMYAFFMHLFFLDLPFVFYLVYLLQLSDIGKSFEVIRYLLIYFLSILKALNLMWKFEKIQNLAKSITDLMEFSGCLEKNNIKTFSVQLAKARRVFKVFFSVGILAILIGLSQPFFTGQLVLKMWFPFAPSNGIKFRLTAVYHLLTSLHSSCLSVTLDVIPIFFLSYVIGFIKVLERKIKSLGTSPLQDQNISNLKKCFETQIKIKDAVKDFEEIFTVIMSIQGGTSVVLLCVISFSATIVSLLMDLF